MTDFVLTLSCPDRPGIVAAVSDFLFNNKMNITESHQFGALETQNFFMRVRFETTETEMSATALEGGFTPIAEMFEMSWRLYDMSHKPNALILVSKFDHCLVDLLYRTRTGALNMNIAGIFSNHEINRPYAEREGIPFTFFEVNKDTKSESEHLLRKLVSEQNIEFLVLARYMQVLSGDFTADYPGQIINIHHSFLPSFKGAVPYSRAYERGVKMIGATAHYVTANLDEGPIISQNVAPVRHDMTVEKMVTVGREVEQQVLADAIAAHTERRILLNGHKTVVFT